MVVGRGVMFFFGVLYLRCWLFFSVLLAVLGRLYVFWLGFGALGWVCTAGTFEKHVACPTSLLTAVFGEMHFHYRFVLLLCPFAIMVKDTDGLGVLLSVVNLCLFPSECLLLSVDFFFYIHL